jgi:hypothetical protein
MNGKGERVTQPGDFGKQLKETFQLQPKETCTSCHH